MLGLIKSSQVSFLHLNICLVVHVRLSAYVVAHTRGPEDNFLESVLSSTMWAPKMGLCRHACYKCLYLLSHSPGQNMFMTQEF